MSEFEGKPVIKFPFRFKDNIATCFLDPERGWWPSRVTIHHNIKNNTTITVTKFGRENGRWFPVECRSETTHDGHVEAGIAHACTVILWTNDDLTNLDSALTARDMNADARIVLRLL